MKMKIEVFTRRGCPNCPAVLAYCEKRFGEIEWVNCDSEGGMELARARGVQSVPTAVFFDSDGAELARCRSVAEIKKAEESRVLGAGEE